MNKICLREEYCAYTKRAVSEEKKERNGVAGGELSDSNDGNSCLTTQCNLTAIKTAA